MLVSRVYYGGSPHLLSNDCLWALEIEDLYGALRKHAFQILKILPPI